MGKKNLNWKNELKKICEILKGYGINIEQIPTKATSSDGKRYFILLKDLKIEELDIDEIIRDNNLDANFPIGRYINKFRAEYNKTQGNLTDEEIKYGEELGIVQKRKGTPIFKGGKVSQFHIDYINGNIDKIISGELNTLEVLKLMEEASIKHNETVIKDAGSIKRIVRLLLKDRPDDLKKYNKNVTKNTGRRNSRRGNIGRPTVGTYHEKEKEFNRKVIEVILPQIMSGETTFDKLEQELHVSHHTIDKIIKDYYLKNNDFDGLEAYEKAKSRNMGVSNSKRQEAKKMREEVKQYDVVLNREFVLLPPEEQMRQLIMKIRVEKLKEEKKGNDNQTRLLTEEGTIARIERTMNYFRNKNLNGSKKIYFSDEDIRYMIFRYPTLISRSESTLDEKFGILTSYEEIDEATAYGMIKTFPALMGYDVERTKKQLDLLQKENLMDYVISTPSALMRSVSLMYALIEYAKERHHTSNLEDINRNNIFMANTTLKRFYGTTYDELKQKYKYDLSKEEDEEYKITRDSLPMHGTSISKVGEAEKILGEAIRSLELDDKKGEHK